MASPHNTMDAIRRRCTCSTLVPPSAWLGLPWKNATPKASFSRAEWTFRLHSAYNGPMTSRSGTTGCEYLTLVPLRRTPAPRAIICTPSEADLPSDHPLPHCGLLELQSHTFQPRTRIASLRHLPLDMHVTPLCYTVLCTGVEWLPHLQWCITAGARQLHLTLVRRCHDRPIRLGPRGRATCG